MEGMYLGVFSEMFGGVRRDTGEAYFRYLDGAIADEVEWDGDLWTRASDECGNVVHYTRKTG